MKNTNQKTIKKDTPRTMDMEIRGMQVTIVFAEREDTEIKERIIDIISSEYEKKRLGNAPIS